MTYKSTLSLGLMLAPIVALLMASSSACILNDDFIRAEDVFACQRDSDCGEPGFACDPSSNTCKPKIKIVQCTDMDEDGYGSGEFRDDCERTGEDPDDSNDKIYPNAPELCDGLDNNANNTVDEPISCAENTLVCASLSIPIQGAFFTCREGGCVLIPPTTVNDPPNMIMCQGVTIPCTNGAYDDTMARANNCF